MARVQVFKGGSVRQQGTTGERVRAADFGPSALGVGLKAAGQALGRYAENEQDIADLQDRASVKEAVNALGQHYSEIGYTGPNAYFNKGGKNALNDRPMVEKSIDSFIDQSRRGLATDRQRKLYDEAVTPQRQSWGVQIAQHSAKEARQYDVDETSSRIGISGELARSTYVSDPEHGEDQIATGLNEIDNLAKLNDWGADRVAVEKLKFTSGTYRDIGQRLAYEDKQVGPDLAEAFVQKHKDSMTGDDREAVLNHARVQRNAAEAEQRRLEAEERRLAREAKTDAKDRANSVYRNIQDGVPVDDKTLADAITDATTAGDEALAEGLRQGGLKNNLTREYAGASPVEMQNRVNDLTAQIQREGDKVKPDTIVERDHLQILLGRANTALKSDPLSYASQLGIDVPPLNLNDGSSISGRISAANAVQRRTGMPGQVLTQEEAAVFAPIVKTGSIKQKTQLITSLARFGNYAVDAARQIDPRDAGFQGLVGLATHRNRSVAMSRVNQAITGYEVLKTKPKLIDNALASRQAESYIGGALRFFPTTKQGILANAGALLAAESDERGYSEWGEAQGRWFAAINSAMGAYTRNGEQVGGLHTFNGAATILPEDMGEREFDARISRSQGPQIKAAQNGTPLYGDGRAATATEVKKLQWVPSRDGVYRISNGTEFLTLKDGRYYEVDVRKLR